MRFLIDDKSYEEMLARKDHTPDCFVRPGEYLHHLYRDGVKYTVLRAVLEGIKQAQEKQDREAYMHLVLHKKQFDRLYAQARKKGINLQGVRLLGDPPPKDSGSTHIGKTYIPPRPQKVSDTGLSMTLMYDLILRAVYNRGRPTGGEIASDLGLSY
ncbi:MAG: ATP-binding protein, partial [Anaerolineae bacterium]